MVLPIYVYGHPVLRKVAEDIPVDYPNLQQLIADMWDTLAESEGIGLAAPQIAKSIRVVVIDLDVISNEMPKYKDYRRVFINPHIIETSLETTLMEEGCLSLPAIHEKVSRHAHIRIQYIDEELNSHDEWVKDDYLARVMQHEFDHLEGKVFVDRISSLRKQLIKSKLRALAQGRYRCGYKTKGFVK